MACHVVVGPFVGCADADVVTSRDGSVDSAVAGGEKERDAPEAILALEVLQKCNVGTRRAYAVVDHLL